MANPEPMPRKKVVSLVVAVSVPSLFVFVILLVFSPIAALLFLLALVVGLGLLRRAKPEFFEALKRPAKAQPSYDPIAPPPPSKSSKRTYMMLVGINAMNQQRVTVNESPFIIGRDKSCSFHLDYPQVSRHHLTITYQPEEKLCYVTDNSSNGTFLNSRRMAKGEKLPLHQGDALQIAGIIFSVEYVHY